MTDNVFREYGHDSNQFHITNDFAYIFTPSYRVLVARAVIRTNATHLKFINAGTCAGGSAVAYDSKFVNTSTGQHEFIHDMSDPKFACNGGLAETTIYSLWPLSRAENIDEFVTLQFGIFGCITKTGKRHLTIYIISNVSISTIIIF